MKVFVVSKKTLIYALAASVLIIAAILAAVIAGSTDRSGTRKADEEEALIKQTFSDDITRKDAGNIGFQKVEE
jgi:hypothetical protein